MLAFGEQNRKKYLCHNKEQINNTIPEILKRASCIKENTDPKSSDDKLIFICKENKKKSKDSFLNSQEILDFLDNYENVSIENSFILEDIKQKEKEKNKLFNIVKNLTIKNEENKFNNLISEDDLFFKDILREKLIKKKEEKNPLRKYTHLNILKIPFPKHPDKIKQKKNYNIDIYLLKEKLKGKFILGKFVIEVMKRDDLISFVNKKEEYENKRNCCILDEKLISKEDILNVFVGIKIKKINEIYYLTYMYAQKA